MNPRVLEIFDRLESIDSEAKKLRKELQEIFSEKKGVGTDQDDFSMFKDTTRRLLIEFLNVSGNILTQDDIKTAVICDEWASDSAVRSVIKRARKEIRTCPDCHYEIKSISQKTYKMEINSVSKCVSKVSKKHKQ